MLIKTSNSQPEMIQVPADTFLNELMWSATRYCIGRSSYVSSYALTFWKLLKDNIDKFPKQTLAFFARDIRAEVSDYVARFRNVHLEGSYNSMIVKDAYSLIVDYLAQHPGVNKDETLFEVNCVECTVNTNPWVAPEDYKYGLFAYSIDLPAWITLANCIDSLKEVVLQDKEGKEHMFVCAERPFETGIGYVLANDWYSQIDPKNVASVKPLENKILKDKVFTEHKCDDGTYDLTTLNTQHC